MSHLTKLGICALGFTLTISLISCDSTTSGGSTVPGNSLPAESDVIGAATESAHNPDDPTAGCTVAEETDYSNGFFGQSVANIQSDVDADGQLDTVELLTQHAYDGGEYHNSVKARVKVTFANGGVAASDIVQIHGLPDGHTLHAIDLHYEADGFQEIIYDTSYGSDYLRVQRTEIFSDCNFKQAASQTSQQAIYIPLQEYVSETNQPERSWGCSRDNGLLEMKTLKVIETDTKRWTIDTWRLVDSTWEFVDSEFDQGSVSPGKLTKDCLLP